MHISCSYDISYVITFDIWEVRIMSCCQWSPQPDPRSHHKRTLFSLKICFVLIDFENWDGRMDMCEDKYHYRPSGSKMHVQNVQHKPLNQWMFTRKYTIHTTFVSFCNKLSAKHIEVKNTCEKKAILKIQPWGMTEKSDDLSSSGYIFSLSKSYISPKAINFLLLLWASFKRRSFSSQIFEKNLSFNLYWSFLLRWFTIFCGKTWNSLDRKRRFDSNDYWSELTIAEGVWA